LVAQQLQQHINRGNKRVARMTGRSEPAEHELRAEMHKRMYLLGSGPELRVRSSASIAEGSNFSKRYFRHSHQAAKNTSRTNTTSGISTPSTTNATTSGNSTGPGVSTLDIQAATNGGLTPANKPTANNTLGLDIE
jgi:hypothetical protein